MTLAEFDDQNQRLLQMQQMDDISSRALTPLHMNYINLSTASS
jgi:hypothetical protein